MPGSAWEIPQATPTGLLNGADSEAGRSRPREPAASSLPGPAEAGEDGPFSSVTGQTTRLGSEPRLQSRLTGPPAPLAVLPNTASGQQTAALSRGGAAGVTPGTSSAARPPGFET